MNFDFLSLYVLWGRHPLLSEGLGEAFVYSFPRWNRAFLKIRVSEKEGNYPWRGLYNLILTPSVSAQELYKNTYQNIHIIKAITKHTLSFYAILQYPPNRDLGFPSFENKYIRFQNYNPPSQNLILFSTQTSSFLC